MIIGAINIFSKPIPKALRKFAKRYQFFLLLISVIFSISVARYFLSLELMSENSPDQFIGTNEQLSNSHNVLKGETFGGIFNREGLSREDSQKIIRLANQEKLTDKLKIGQEINFEYDASISDQGDDLLTEEKKLARVWIPLSNVKTIEFVKDSEGEFTVNYLETALSKMIAKYEATIENSFMSSLQKAGLSTNSIINVANAFSHQIDFQRQIRSGDKIEVITEKFIDDQSSFSHHGDILYASIYTGGKKYEIFRYAPNGKNSTAQYFTSSGNSIKSTLLRTPVNVVRISSHYGYRKKHPVLGYGRMHKGVDFAAPIGTPIYASGDGVVDFVGWKSGYGRFVLIKHNKNLSTAYAHSSRFAKNLRKGSRVKQGDIIAYVGKSGRVTGPHLHYEVRIKGKQVNPMRFKSTPGVHLTGNSLKKFKTYQKNVLNLGKRLSTEMDIAADDIKDFTLF